MAVLTYNPLLNIGDPIAAALLAQQGDIIPPFGVSPFANQLTSAGLVPMPDIPAQPVVAVEPDALASPVAAAVVSSLLDPRKKIYPPEIYGGYEPPLSSPPPRTTAGQEIPDNVPPPGYPPVTSDYLTDVMPTDQSGVTSEYLTDVPTVDSGAAVQERDRAVFQAKAEAEIAAARGLLNPNTPGVSFPLSWQNDAILQSLAPLDTLTQDDRELTDRNALNVHSYDPTMNNAALVPANAFPGGAMNPQPPPAAPGYYTAPNGAVKFQPPPATPGYYTAPNGAVIGWPSLGGMFKQGPTGTFRQAWNDPGISTAGKIGAGTVALGSALFGGPVGLLGGILNSMGAYHDVGAPGGLVGDLTATSGGALKGRTAYVDPNDPAGLTVDSGFTQYGPLSNYNTLATAPAGTYIQYGPEDATSRLGSTFDQTKWDVDANTYYDAPFRAEAKDFIGDLTQAELAAEVSAYPEEYHAIVGGTGDGGGDSGGDGTVICTELARQGLIPEEWFEADAATGKEFEANDPDVITGYHCWAIPVAKLMSKSKIVTRIASLMAIPWAKEMYIRQGNNGFSTLRGKIAVHVGVPICRLVGKIIRGCQEIGQEFRREEK